MTTTRSQIRKMDDVNLSGTIRRLSSSLRAEEAKGNDHDAKALAVLLREAEVELSRREALEAA